MVVNMMMASFVGFLVGSFLSPEFPYRDGFVGIGGFSTLSILALLEAKAPKMIMNIINRKQ